MIENADRRKEMGRKTAVSAQRFSEEVIIPQWVELFERLMTKRKPIDMKVLFLIFHGLNPASGISKKILAQVRGLQQCGHEVHFCNYDFDTRRHRICSVNDKIITDFGKGSFSALRRRCSYGDLYRYCVDNDINAVYCRSFHNANPWTIHLFSKLRKAGIKSVLEIPTYPYDREYEQFPLKEKTELLVDKVFRRRLARQMSGLVTFSGQERIFGQRTIRISNGIDFDEIPLHSPKQHKSDEIHLIGVAEVHLWHGFDRLIAGLADYYSKGSIEKKVFFHIVGGVIDEYLLPWRAFIKEKKIEPYVIFHGTQFGEKLTDLFNLSDFAVGSLGRHRSGIEKIKTLKNREYAARGIPFVYSETDDDFEDMPYIIKAPADESPISVSSILNFYSRLSISSKDIRESILHCSWRNQMNIVMNAL